MMQHLIALGANSGPSRAANLARVVQAGVALRRAFGVRVRLSPAFATPAWPPGIGPDFVNAVAVLRSDLPPARLLARLHAMEARAGRVRDRRWGARVLDLDLIASGALVRPDVATWRHWALLPLAAQRMAAPDRLILPHPRMQSRAFVLIPLACVAPGWQHPVTGRRVAAMRAALVSAQRRGIRRLAVP